MQWVLSCITYEFVNLESFEIHFGHLRCADSNFLHHVSHKTHLAQAGFHFTHVNISASSVFTNVLSNVRFICSIAHPETEQICWSEDNSTLN